MYNSIVNPISKKNVNLNTKLGRKILQIYIKSLGGSSLKSELSPSNRSSKRNILGPGRALKRGRKKVDIDRENTQKLISQIPVKVWEKIIKCEDHSDIERIVDMLRKVNEKFRNFLTREKCAEIVLEARKNYLLQLVEDDGAVMIDENTILQFDDINDDEWILNETVVEFQDEEILRRSLEEVNYMTEDNIEKIMNSNIFLITNLEEIPARADGHRMPTIFYTLGVIFPLTTEDGDEIDIILDDIEMTDLNIVGKIVNLNCAM